MLLGISGDRLDRVRKRHRGIDLRCVSGARFLRNYPARADVHAYLLALYHSTAEPEPTKQSLR